MRSARRNWGYWAYRIVLEVICDAEDRQAPVAEFGTTYGPTGDGPFPAVVVLHGSGGSWSGWSHRNAVMLAAYGFLAYPQII